MSHDCNAEVAEQDFVVCAKEHVLRLDVTVDAPLVMSILQGGGDLLDIGDDGGEWKACSARMAEQERAVGSVFHDQVGDVVGCMN